VFHAGSLGRPGGGYGTNGGRVLTVVGRGAHMTAARTVAERAADAVSWEGLQRRRDIAADEPALATTPGPVPATTAGAAR
jgi:phosphoribosylamine--glycine ligase